jgi:hypothetical protein
MKELIVRLMETQAFIFLLGFSLIVVPILGIMIVVNEENDDGKL